MAVTTWTFASNYEAWTFEDQSEATTSASRSYSSGQIDVNLLGPGPQSAKQARGYNISPTALGIAIANGDTIDMDHGAPSDGLSFTRGITATFTDTTTQSVSDSVTTIAGTKTLTFSSGVKTLDKIECFFIRTGNAGGRSPFDVDIALEEVRLTTAGAGYTGTGQKPLGLDVGLETGTQIYTTYWDGDLGGDLMLREYDASIALQNTYTIANGTATITDIDARTFFLSPYTPPFFGTASLEDIMYIYGRWDDGAVKHVAKSTDAGASFANIGDSAVWLTGWVGGFFADDANTLYAFVNGASRALYRSLDAGANWTSLSSLPFDVDPHGVSKHPDGRILIANRLTGAQMAAYADSAYAAWTNATGSPSFPTGGGGARSIIWIT